VRIGTQRPQQPLIEWCACANPQCCAVAWLDGVALAKSKISKEQQPASDRMKNRNMITPHQKATGTNFYLGKDTVEYLELLSSYYGITRSAIVRLILAWASHGNGPSEQALAREQARRRGSAHEEGGFTIYPNQLCALDQIAERYRFNRSQMLRALITTFANEVSKYTREEIKVLLDRARKGCA